MINAIETIIYTSNAFFMSKTVVISMNMHFSLHFSRSNNYLIRRLMHSGCIHIHTK